MLDRLSVNIVLKCSISVLGAVAIFVLASGAVQSWSAFKGATRIATATETSAHLFKALYSLRTDRVATNRDLQTDTQYSAPAAYIQEARAITGPALRSALEAVKQVDFPERAKFVDNLDQSIKKLSRLHAQTAAALLRPKADRPAQLVAEHFSETGRLIELVERLSQRMIVLVKRDDPLVDQMMDIRQLAWSARNVAGDLQGFVSAPLAGLPVAADALTKHATMLGQVHGLWSAIAETANGLTLPPTFAAALERAQRGFLSPEYSAFRMNALKTLIVGGKPDISVKSWVDESIAKLVTLQGVAEVALDIAKDYAETNRAHALQALGIQLYGLAATITLVVAMMIMVSRRVTSPLLIIMEAMRKLTAGDLSARVSFGQRHDEIGALADAMHQFKDGMIEADRLRAEQHNAEERANNERQAAREQAEAQQKAAEEKAAAERKAVLMKLADDFETTIRSVVTGVSSAAAQLESTAGALTKTADGTKQLTTSVASSSEEASASVQSVAAATEEMSASVEEIARRVNESSRIAEEAVKQAEQTDGRISELSHAASRIGDVVKLITAIAEQTNLLALNATIEAARAGDAGKGFAVVAQEVKALASQTATATEDIGTQISGMQAATRESVVSIKTISGTIARISEIASAVAAAAQQQSGTTQEIARNIHEAAKGTADVATNVADVSRGAQETGSASAQVLMAATLLSTESSRMTVEVDNFLRAVRAA